MRKREIDASRERKDTRTSEEQSGKRQREKENERRIKRVAIFTDSANMPVQVHAAPGTFRPAPTQEACLVTYENDSSLCGYVLHLTRSRVLVTY
jgi:hypothetical protein